MKTEPESNNLEPETASRIRLDAVPGPVKELAELQVAHGLSDAAFAESVRLGFVGSTWGKIKAGTFDGNLEQALRKVRLALTRATTKGLDPAAGRFVMFEHVRGVLSGVRIAQQTPQSQNRLIVFLGNTGMGKTEIAKHLERELGATRVDGQPSWGSSYMAALSDIALALGVHERIQSRHQAERAILNELRSAPRLLVIDEANYFTTDGLNFIKAIMNLTQAVVVLCTLPDDFLRWKSANRHETRQLVRRSVGVLRAPPVTARDVLSVQAAGWPDLHITAAAPKVAAAANKIAGYDLVVRFLEELDPDDPEDVDSALARAMEQLAEGQ